ncbi:MAG: 30S ribosomal protein S2 [Actinomycetes bacterium]
MAATGIRELLEAGVHFGHQTQRWDPRMRRYIHGEMQGIYLIDLLQTEALLAKAQAFCAETARRGGTVLFVGTKKQARDAVREAAEAADMPYVNHRWLGGLLTNFQTISRRIKRLHDLERYSAEGQLALLPTKERMSAEADLVKLTNNLGGVKHMTRVPDVVIVFDINTEEIAVKEANRLRIPVIALVDTNCDPTGVDFVIPGNDDAMRSCQLIANSISDVIAQSRGLFKAEEEQARAEAAARALADKENREKREAEEAARRLAVEEEAATKAAAQAVVIEAAEAEQARAEAEVAVREAVAERVAEQAEANAAAEAATAAEPEAPAAEATPEADAEPAKETETDAAPDEAAAPAEAEAPAEEAPKAEEESA